MAHEITATDKMVYYGQKPWHGLGIEMPGLMTAKEAFDAAFGWRVEQKELYIKHGENFVPVTGSWRANVRSDNLETVGIVTDAYQVLQPEKAFEFFDEVTMDPNGPKYVTAGSLKGGRKMWLLAKMPDFIRITEKDRYEDYLLLSNSFDGSTAVEILWTPVRVVCNNTLTVALNQAGSRKFKMRHFPSIAKAKSARDFLGIVEEKRLELSKFAEDLLNVPCGEDKALEFYGELFPNAPLIKAPGQKAVGPVQRIMDLWENPHDFEEMRGTAYFALNQLTDFIDHDRFQNAETRMESLLYGSKAELKEKAVSVAERIFLS